MGELEDPNLVTYFRNIVSLAMLGKMNKLVIAQIYLPVNCLNAHLRKTREVGKIKNFKFNLLGGGFLFLSIEHQIGQCSPSLLGYTLKITAAEPPYLEATSHPWIHTGVSDNIEIIHQCVAVLNYTVTKIVRLRIHHPVCSLRKCT